MSYYIIDRRKNDRNKSLLNRKRFFDRAKGDLKESIKQVIKSEKIKDILSSKGKKVVVPGRGLQQPNFNFDASGGHREYVLTGNDRFSEGDKIYKPPQDEEGDGSGNGAGTGDGGEDAFSFHLTRQEFMDLYFEDLELPDLVKKELAKVKESIPKRTGFSNTGTPNRLNILRSMRQAKGRKFALIAPKKRKLKKLEDELNRLLAIEEAVLTEEDKKQIIELKSQIAALEKQIKKIPFIDDLDLRYNRWDVIPQPVTQAVIFAILDVSGSMGEWEKEMAKTFFIFLALFLEFNYESVDIVWIQHASSAREVTEEEFFYAKDTGGTVVSTSLQLTKQIIQDRYPPNKWNIFISQISDGDNGYDDNVPLAKILQDDILPIVRYYTYVETRKNAHTDAASSLMGLYDELEDKFKNLKTSIISNAADIYPVFRKLFEKRTKNV